MLQMSIVVGKIGNNVVSIRRTSDGSIIVKIECAEHVAEYQRTQKGLLMISSNYPRSAYEKLYADLMANLKEIDRKSIEMTEAEMRIAYIEVLRTEGFLVSIGQSNSLSIFITVERDAKRALLMFADAKISFVNSSFTKDENKYIRTLITQNVEFLLSKMEENDMIPNRKTDAPHLYNPDGGDLNSGMSEVGVKERVRVDRQINSMFRNMESKGYSNLEIQSMLMESVLETAMQARVNVKQRTLT